MAKKYCLDTSFFINGWRKHYAIDVFPSVWTTVEKSITRGEIISCYEVFQELESQRDDLFAWAKRNRGIFLKPNDDVVHQLGELMYRFPNFAANGGSANAADPWLIAQALHSKAAIVTDEQFQAGGKPTKPPKIPNVCADLDVECLKPIEFLRALKISL